jgi:predicted ArsR family transcriptional regulator
MRLTGYSVRIRRVKTSSLSGRGFTVVLCYLLAMHQTGSSLMPNVAVSAAGLRLLKLLVGNPPQTVCDLIRAAGVTRTAVTEQLNDLVAAGFVERDTQRPLGRGRPRHLYRAAETAPATLFAGNQWLIVSSMWRAVADVGGEELVKKVLKRAARTMAEHYNAKITAKRGPERLRQLVGLLVAEGALADAVENDAGQLLLRKRSCPFLGAVDPRRSVCHADQEMIGAVVGSPVRRTACRHDGHPCCTFEIVGE